MSISPKSQLLGLCMLLGISIVACNNSALGDLNRFSGTFVHATRGGDVNELRKISLPTGEVLNRLELPSSGAGSLSGPGGLSDCTQFVVTDFSLPENKEGIFAVDMQ